MIYGVVFEFSNRLDDYCINNQVEYEALLFVWLGNFAIHGARIMLKLLVTRFLLCSKYLRYAIAIIVH